MGGATTRSSSPGGCLPLTGAPLVGARPPPQVHKFGGTCVAAAERIEAICKYLVEQAAGAAADEKQVVVVSAMGSHPSSPVKVRF